MRPHTDGCLKNKPEREEGEASISCALNFGQNREFCSIGNDAGSWININYSIDKKYSTVIEMGSNFPDSFKMKSQEAPGRT